MKANTQMKFYSLVKTVILSLAACAWLMGNQQVNGQTISFTPITDKTEADQIWDQLSPQNLGFATTLVLGPGQPDYSQSPGTLSFTGLPGTLDGYSYIYIYSKTLNPSFPTIIHATLTVQYDGSTGTVGYALQNDNIDLSVNPPQWQYTAPRPALHNQFNEIAIYQSDFYESGPTSNTLGIVPSMSTQGITFTGPSLIISPSDHGFERDLNYPGHNGYKVCKITGFNSLNSFTLTVPCTFTSNSWPAYQNPTQYVYVRGFNNPNEPTPPVGPPPVDYGKEYLFNTSAPSGGSADLNAKLQKVQQKVLNNNRLWTTFANLGLGTQAVQKAYAVFQTVQAQSLHVSISADITGLNTSLDVFPSAANVRVELYDSHDRLVTPGLQPSTAPAQPLVYNTVSDLPPDTYHLVLTPVDTGLYQYSPTVTISGGNNWQVMTLPGNAKAHHVGLYPANRSGDLTKPLPPITQGTPNTPANVVATWVVIHGRQSNPTSFSGLTDLESALANLPEKPQVLVVDWETAAWDNADFVYPVEYHGIIPVPDLSGELWIKRVGDAAASMLQNYGVTAPNVALVGHSWGAYVAQQLAHDYGKVRALVALDPAFIGAEITDDGRQHAVPANSINAHGALIQPYNGDYFSRAAQSSWAFYSSTFGNYPYALTAARSFVVFSPWQSMQMSSLRNWWNIAVWQQFQSTLFNFVFQTHATEGHDLAASAFARAVYYNNPANMRRISSPQMALEAALWLRFSPALLLNPNRNLWNINQAWFKQGGGSFYALTSTQVYEWPGTPFLLDGTPAKDGFPLEAVLRVDNDGHLNWVWPARSITPVK